MNLTRTTPRALPTTLGLLPCVIVFSFGAYAGVNVIKTELVASGFQLPVFVCAPPGDPTRLFVVERKPGRIQLIKNGVRASEPFLDIDNKTNGNGEEQGLLGLAFHPDYATNRFFFVNYTGKDGATKIVRYKARKSLDRAKKKTGTLILTIPQPFDNHNGGMIAFSPIDKRLYIGTGDGGSANDPYNHGQRLDTLLGKLLRINVDAGQPYSVPASNPFVGQSGARGEIWAYGLRNPWRWSFDRLTGALYMGDVGQVAREEVNYQPPTSTGGENYGWRIAEGFACLGGNGSCGTNSGFTPPIYDYTRDIGITVVGGYVYRGTAIPSLQGTYFFADFSFARIWSLKYNGVAVSEFTDRTAELDPPGSARIGAPSSFGEDANGELYIADYSDGEVYRIVPNI